MKFQNERETYLLRRKLMCKFKEKVTPTVKKYSLIQTQHAQSSQETKNIDAAVEGTQVWKRELAPPEDFKDLRKAFGIHVFLF